MLKTKQCRTYINNKLSYQNNLTELKAFASPPAAVAMVAQAVLVLFSPKGKVPKDRSWKACKVMMGGADQFLSNLRNYDKGNIHPEVVKAIQLYIKDKGFSLLLCLRILFSRIDEATITTRYRYLNSSIIGEEGRRFYFIVL